MADAPPAAADWRDEDAYRPLLEAERSAFAWEWLRRDGRYREEARAALSERSPDVADAEAARWGLHAFEAPVLAAPEARPVWRADRHGQVLALAACRSMSGGGSFDLDRLAPIATRIRRGSGQEHWLLSDGLRSVRFDIAGAGCGTSGARLCCPLSDLMRRDAPLLALRRLVALYRTGRFASALHRPERRARRWIQMLRTHDALAAGATQREIAAALLGSEAGAPRWRIEAPSLRSQVQRLVRSARRMGEGGYRLFLEGDETGSGPGAARRVSPSSGPI